MVEAAASGPARWNLRRSGAVKLRRTLLRAGSCCAPEAALRSESWKMLRRNPPVFAAVPDAVGNMRGLMAGYIRMAWT